MSFRRKTVLLFALLVLTAAGALFCGAAGGWEMLRELVNGNLSAGNASVLFEIRLPRITGAAAAGVLLAAAGCTVQLLFRNPLSSPHVLGSVNASALGAVGVMACGVTAPGWLLCGSSAGALAALGLLLALPRRNGRIAVLLLAGIALNAFASAAMSGLLFMAGERLEGLVFWLLGGFWKLDWHSTGLLLAVTAVILPVLLTVRREMNMLYLGEDAARHAGVDTRKIIAVAVITSSLATAAVVASCGVIGFVGLLVPHIARAVFGGDFARHLAGSALIGAVLMIGADCAARTLMNPMEVPVGVLTSLIGAPFFLFLILRKLKQSEI